MGRLFGYVRVSTDMQEASAEAQQDTLLRYAASIGRPLDGLYVDQDVSGGVPLRDRPKGKELWDALQSGDTVAVTTQDRGFRNFQDVVYTFFAWKNAGIRLHILDFPVDLTTDEGEMWFMQKAVFAAYEKKQIGKRTKAGYEHRRRNGQPYGPTRPYGWTVRYDSHGRLAGWEEFPKERDVGSEVLRMRAEGKTRAEIAIALVHAGARKPRKKKGHSDYYHVKDVFLLERAAKAGYPTVPRAFWQDPDYEQKLNAMKSDGPPLLFGGSGSSESGPLPTPARPLAGRQSRGSDSPVTQ